MPSLDAALSASQREQMYFWHALSPLWWEMDYDSFLIERRARMAQIIRQAWEDLSGKAKASTPAPVDVAALIAADEGDEIEFKSTLRTNLHTGQVDEKMHLAVLKTIAGFLNGKGGTLLVGVADIGEVLGLDADKFPSEDKLGLHLVNLLKDRMGEIFLPYVHYRFEDQDGKRTLLVRCEKGPKPAFVKDGGAQRFFVRGGASSQELQGPSITEYMKQRFWVSGHDSSSLARPAKIVSDNVSMRSRTFGKDNIIRYLLDVCGGVEVTRHEEWIQCKTFDSLIVCQSIVSRLDMDNVAYLSIIYRLDAEIVAAERAMPANKFKVIGSRVKDRAA